MSEEKDNSVGYKNPPQHSQFKKGQSGNPNGRPKKAKSLTTLIKNEMNATVIIQENGQQKEMTKMEAMIKGMFANAMKQDPKAIRALLPILLQMEANSEEDSPIILEQSDQELLDRFLNFHGDQEEES